MPPITPQTHAETITEASILDSYLLRPASLRTIVPLTAGAGAGSGFVTLLPARHQTNPTLKRLYSDLQFQRAITIDTVRQNIERECRRSLVLKARLARNVRGELGLSTTSGRNRKRKRTEQENGRPVETEEHEESEPSNNHGTEATNEDETQPNVSEKADLVLDAAFHAHPGLAAPPTRASHHTVQSLLAAMADAVLDLEGEIQTLENQSAEMLSALNESVGSLSDLRYGRFMRMSGGRDASAEDVDGVERRVVEGLQELKKMCELKSGSDTTTNEAR